MMSSTLNLKTYLTTYLKTKEDKAKNDEEEKQIFSCEIVNRGLEHSLQVNGLFSWMSLRWILRLPDSENDLEHSLQGRGRRFFLENGFSPENGLSPKMAYPEKFKIYHILIWTNVLYLMIFGQILSIKLDLLKQS